MHPAKGKTSAKKPGKMPALSVQIGRRDQYLATSGQPPKLNFQTREVVMF
jgi:hypothetical protein